MTEPDSFFSTLGGMFALVLGILGLIGVSVAIAIAAEKVELMRKNEAMRQKAAQMLNDYKRLNGIK